MRKVIAVTTFLTFVIFAVMAVAWTDDADCVWCPSFTCFSSSSCNGCMCLIGPGSGSGRCYGTNHAPEGWTELP